MGKAYFVAVKNESERMFLKTCVDSWSKGTVSDFSPVGDISLNQQNNHRTQVAELTYYVNAITSRMYGQNEWCEFRDKMKDLALKCNRDLEDFFEYTSSKRKDYPYDE